MAPTCTASRIAPGFAVVSGTPQHGLATHGIGRHIHLAVRAAKGARDGLGRQAADRAAQQWKFRRSPIAPAILADLKAKRDPIQSNSAAEEIHRSIVIPQ